MFRASNKGLDHLRLSWKLSPEYIIELEISEQKKINAQSEQESIFVLEGMKYQSLEELERFFIMPCNQLFTTILTHPRYLNVPVAESYTVDLEKHPNADKVLTKDLKYGLVIDSLPLHFCIHFVYESKTYKEYVKITPKGLHFHNGYFSNAEMLTEWFEMNIGKKDYMKQMRSNKKLVVVLEDLEDEEEDEDAIKFIPPPPKPEMEIEQKNSLNNSFSASADPRVKEASQQQPAGSWGQPPQQDTGNSWGNDPKPVETQSNAWGAPPQIQEQSNLTSGGGWGFSGGNNQNDSGGSFGGGERRGRGGFGGGDRPRGCFNCGEEGHMSRECPNPKTERGRGGRGRGGGGRGGGDAGDRPRGCFNCKQEGHMSRDCPEPKVERGPSTCFNCKQEGHMSRDCPEPKKERGPPTCFNCGEEGHMSRECSQPQKERRGGRGGRGRFSH